ncbi:MAG: glycosyltransferase family 2 protein, partial [Methylocella sp.]
GCFRMVVEAQARSEAAFGGKWQIPAKNPPWRSSKPLAFPHGLLGFRILDYAIDNKSASPRVCFQFSEPLTFGKADFAPFVTVFGFANAAISAEHQQLCVQGPKHGEHCRIVLRDGLPSAAGKALRNYKISVRDRSPLVGFTCVGRPRGPTMDKLCVVSTVRATATQILYFVNYHINIGIDEVILFFDDPNDESIVYFDAYNEVNCITCDVLCWETHGNRRPSSIEERQEINANMGLELAMRNGFQWIAHIDSGELIFTKGDLREILSGCPVDVDVLTFFSIREAAPERGHYENIFEPTLFKKPGNERRETLALLFGCRGGFFEGEYFGGHRASKVAVRISRKIMRMGIHGPKPPNEGLAEVKTHRIKLLHYDCVGMEAWKTKWAGRIDGSRAVAATRPNRKRQLEVFREAFVKYGDELANLYNRLYIIPKYERIVLKLLGLLELIKLDADLFARPKNNIRA